MRFSLATAASVAALAFAGCGGGDDESNQALSYSEFGAAVDEVCLQVSEDIDPIQERITGDPQKDAPVFDELIPELEAGTNRLAELDPPEELQATFDDYVEVVEQLEAGATDAQEAAETGDQAEYQRVLESVQELNSESSLLASKLGAAGCID